MTPSRLLHVLLPALIAQTLLAQTPGVINYQGRLINGTNLVNGMVGVSLRIYTNDVGGTMLYEDSNSVAVVDGLYSTFIGDDTTAGNLTTALAAPDNKFVEVAIDGAALSPREPLAAVAYARTAVLKSGDTMTGALTVNEGPQQKLTIKSDGFIVAIGNGANGDTGGGVAVGYQANAQTFGVAIGAQAVGTNYGAAMGSEAHGGNHGAAVGYQADGAGDGAAVGYQANGYGFGAAVGYQANGDGGGVAVGFQSTGDHYGVAMGYYADGSVTGAAVGVSANGSLNGAAVGYLANGYAECVAVGAYANAGVPAHAVALGYQVTNDVPDSTRVRGTLYIDGGTGVLYRSTFGSGAWSTLPAPSVTTNFVQKTGDTMTGPLTVQTNIDLSYTQDFGAGDRTVIAIGGGVDVQIGNGAAAYNYGVAIGGQANGYDGSVAVGYQANARPYGVALGNSANGASEGVAVGGQANGEAYGVAVGEFAAGEGLGVAVGFNAMGTNVGAAMGYRAKGSDYGAAVGSYANGFNYGAALGAEANGYTECVAIGAWANAQSTHSSALGYQVTNNVANSTRIRGDLYIDGGGSTINYRTSFGSGGWSTKAFTIDHPLDPQNKVLRHFCLEGPVVQNVYNGTAVLDPKGEATVELPAYFEKLNINPQYLLTPVGAQMNLFVKKEIANNRFVIGGGSPGGKACWEIKAQRNDPAAVEDLKTRPVEQLKSEMKPGQMAAEAASANTDASTSR